MERLIGQQGRSMAELSLAEALELWETAKQAHTNIAVEKHRWGV
jgi:hypothetical protein